MDLERRKLRQNIKVIIAEIFMVISVITMTFVLVFIVLGYWINSDLEIERSGLLQVSSFPTGANITVDHNTWLTHTNTSRMIMSGKHEVKITKNGYDSWSKTVQISDGLLYRLFYPRLFLKNRVKESVLTLHDSNILSVSPKHESLLLNNQTKVWQWVKLNKPDITTEKIDLTSFLTSSIKTLTWSPNETKVLANLANNEWLLIDLNNPRDSINLSLVLEANFEQVQILDDDANNLLAIQKGNLRKIDVNKLLLTRALIKRVEHFYYSNDEVIFTATTEAGEPYIGTLDLRAESTQEILKTSKPALAIPIRFYDEKYLILAEEYKIKVLKRDNLETILTSTINFNPDQFKVHDKGEFVVFSHQGEIATLDMEEPRIVNWQLTNPEVNWLDDQMIYEIVAGELIVYDFDSLNRRIISNQVTSTQPAIITQNKWLYYVSTGELKREWLIPR